jgi:bacteriocin biosynthesis cyclodehydratase domain-containing protein
MPDNWSRGGAGGVGAGDAGHPGARGGGARSPAQLLSRRDAARVVVAGQARLAAPIAAALAAAGVGHVAGQLAGAVTDDDIAIAGLAPADVGRPVTQAVTDLVTRAAPGVRTTAVSLDQATLLVRVGADPTPATLAARAYARRRLPHLAVTVREGAVVIGPFVGAAGSPCLACLDLHRGDRDPAWRTLAAQLATEPATAQACGATTTLVGVGYAVSEVLTYLDGGTPRSRGATIEIDDAGGERRRTWSVHPRCDCRRGRRSSA